jgi:hypothetical protein
MQMQPNLFEQDIHSFFSSRELGVPGGVYGARHDVLRRRKHLELRRPGLAHVGR